jgi:hypothetical protein
MSEPTLEDLDAVGPARADLLREHGFGSVQSLIEATPAKLVEIDGIGEATATDILASVVRVLDRSEPTVDTPRLEYTAPTLRPLRTLPFPRPTIERSTETAEERTPDVPERQAQADVERETDADSVRKRFQLAGGLIEHAGAGQGRLGRTPIDASSVTATVTVRYRPSDYFDTDPRDVLRIGGRSATDVKQLLEHEPQILQRLQANEAFAAGYTLDAATALTDLDDSFGERVAPLVPKSIRRQPAEILPIRIGAMRAQAGDTATDFDGRR